MLAPSFQEEVGRYHLAVPEITRGNPEPVKELYSRLDDVTLANPFGGIARGWAQVEARLDQAARQFQDGRMLGFDTVTSYTARDTAYLVETEHFQARLDGTGRLAVDARPVPPVPAELQAFADATQDVSVAGRLLE